MITITLFTSVTRLDTEIDLIVVEEETESVTAGVIKDRLLQKHVAYSSAFAPLGGEGEITAVVEH